MVAEEGTGEYEATIGIELDQPIPVTTEEATQLFQVYATHFKKQYKVDQVALGISFPETPHADNAMQFTVEIDDKEDGIIKSKNQFEEDYGVEKTKEIKAKREKLLKKE